MNGQTFDLSGKDYFTEQEAANYCCLSKSHFRELIKTSDLQPGRLGRRNIYRRADLKRFLERTAWQLSNGANTNGSPARRREQPTLIGAREADSAARA